jgi:2-polyprenyl-6-hydroxyphenyl methylase/3-demethylubiquinone-9 3-methyltransferase
MSIEKKRSSRELKEYYGRDYVERFVRVHSPVRLQRLLQYVELRPADRIADFACGNAMLMPYVAPRVASYVGIDFSEDFIKKANEKKNLMGFRNAEFYCSDINVFCENNRDRFDRAFAMDVSEHVYDDDWLEILVSIRKSLKAGGTLYLHTPNALFFVEEMKRHSFLLRQFPGHVAVRSPEENARLLTKAGYRILRLMLIPHYNALRFIHMFSYAPFLGKYLKARIFIEAVK